MTHDRQQPGASLAAAKPVKELVGAQEGLLHDVLRVVVVARQPARQIIGRRQVRQDGLLKLSEFAWLSQPLTSPFLLLHTYKTASLNTVPGPILFPGIH